MTTKFGFYAGVFCLIANFTKGQNVDLHVNPRWEECSFQLDPSLTQKEFSEFTREAGMVACFRPLTDARAMGTGRYELSLLQWKTTVDETKGAWNNTFVHPHDEHYLIGGPALPFPGLSMRAGITEKLDAGVYWTMNPNANYGFLGTQLQYSILNSEAHKLDLASRIGFNAIYGPEDLNFKVYAADLLASKKVNVYKNLVSVSPYAGASVYLASSHEKSDVVNLKHENALGLQAMVGAVARIWNFSLAAEYNFAAVNTMSLRLGYNFKMWSPKKPV